VVPPRREPTPRRPAPAHPSPTFRFLRIAWSHSTIVMTSWGANGPAPAVFRCARRRVMTFSRPEPRGGGSRSGFDSGPALIARLTAVAATSLNRHATPSGGYR
jgi:hypothetical protein